MIRTLKLSSVTCIIVALCGCVTPLPHLEFFNGCVTTGGDTVDFQEIPMTSIPQARRMFVITHVRWDASIEWVGGRTVFWKWYSGEKLVAERKKYFPLIETPMMLHYDISGANFTVGHYRVDVTIDGKVVDSHEFDITQ